MLDPGFQAGADNAQQQRLSAPRSDIARYVASAACITDSVVKCSTGMGASGDTRVTARRTNLSSITSPATRMRKWFQLCGFGAIAAIKRAAARTRSHRAVQLECAHLAALPWAG